jgi:hypothetical protein
MTFKQTYLLKKIKIRYPVIIADGAQGFNMRGEKPVGGGVKRAESPTLRVAGGKR